MALRLAASSGLCDMVAHLERGSIGWLRRSAWGGFGLRSYPILGMAKASFGYRKMKVFQRRFKPMNVIRYQNQGRSDLAHAFDRFAALRDEMDRLFNNSYGPVFRTPGSFSRWAPALDAYQDKDQFTVVAELPGLKKEDIELPLQNAVLTISDHRKHDTKSEEGYL